MHLTKLPSGTWRVTVKHRGQRRTATAASQGDARRLGAELLLEMGGEPPAGQRLTVGELLDSHLAGANISPATLTAYRRVADALPVEFRDRPIQSVNPHIIEALYRQLAAIDGRRWSPHSLNRIHAVLSGAWERAIKYGWARVNPLRSADRPAAEPRATTPPTPGQVSTLIEHATGDMRLFLRLAASTGARRGELVGLRWSAVDLDRSQLSIHMSLAYTAAGGVHERPTKTGQVGHRTIAVGLPVMTELRRHRLAQDEAALASGVERGPWVFSWSAGADPWHPDYPTGAFASIRSRAGLPTVRLHDLRHFVATQMLAAGHSVAQVAARLGQTQAATTARYAHWIKAVDRDAAEHLEALVR